MQSFCLLLAVDNKGTTPGFCGKSWGFCGSDTPSPGGEYRERGDGLEADNLVHDGEEYVEQLRIKVTVALFDHYPKCAVDLERGLV
jgi:hypothetical protein